MSLEEEKNCKDELQVNDHKINVNGWNNVRRQNLLIVFLYRATLDRMRKRR